MTKEDEKTNEIAGEEIESLRKTLEHWQTIANQGIHIEMQLRKELLTIEASTIERCAQVVKDAPVDQLGRIDRTSILAAIRKLKDEP